LSDVVILGAGLTGLSTAFHLEQRGISYEIFEGDATIGGLLRSVTQDGFTFDYTGHLVHISDPYFKAFVDYVGRLENWHCLQRNSFIYSHNTYTPYPFQSNLYGLPTPVIQECITEFIKRKTTIRKPKNFYDWVLKYFGKGIGKHFFFSYNQKILSYNIKKIHPSWTGRFVPNTTLEALFDGALHQKSASSAGYNSFFYYPKQGGIQYLVNCIKKVIKTPINTNHKAVTIDIQNKKIRFSNGKECSYKTLISTIPLDHLTNSIVEPSSSSIHHATQKLLCNTVLNFNLGVSIPNLTHKNWIYFPEKQYEFYRLGFWHTFSQNMVPSGCSSIYGELSYLPGRKTPRELKTLLARAQKKTLNLFGLLETQVITQKNLVLPHAYVIYDQWREKNLSKLLDTLQVNNIYSIGRFGEWKYSSMQEAVLDGKKVVEQILREK